MFFFIVFFSNLGMFPPLRSLVIWVCFYLKNLVIWVCLPPRA